jgi:N-acetylglucosamine-6-phosphate deacetylase
MMQSVKNGVHHAEIPLEEALRMASTYPARMLPAHKLGKIEKGYEARFVVFDDSLVMRKVYC